MHAWLLGLRRPSPQLVGNRAEHVSRRLAGRAQRFWNMFLNWINYRFKVFERLLSPPPLPLVSHGRMNRRNMRQEFITEEDLSSQLRQHGIYELSEVKRACLEANGELSVIKFVSEEDPNRRNHRLRECSKLALVPSEERMDILSQSNNCAGSHILVRPAGEVFLDAMRNFLCKPCLATGLEERKFV
jgi:hypothetical protein